MNVSSVATSTLATRKDVNSGEERVVVKFETSTGKTMTLAAEAGVHRRSWREEERSKKPTSMYQMVLAPLLVEVENGKKPKSGKLSSVLVLRTMKGIMRD